jgi:sugar lactone lactonase YvrE
MRIDLPFRMPETARPRVVPHVTTVLVTIALFGAACSGSNAGLSKATTRPTTKPAAPTPSDAPAEVIGTITTVVGNGFANATGDGGPATEASLPFPSLMGFDAQGNLYIHTEDERIRRIDPSGVITTVVGPPAGGEPPAEAAPRVEGHGRAVDANGNLYVTNEGGTKIVKVTPSGNVTTVAGTGERGFSGDGGPATKAELGQVYERLAIDASGNLYIPDTANNRIRKVDTKGIITTIAGTGKPGFSGDGGPARKAELNGPTNVSLDGKGNIYIADSENHRIRRIDPRGIITTVAGNGKTGFPDDGAVATEVPVGGANVWADPEGNIYITDEGYPGIFKVDPEGILTIIAGTGVDGYSGDGGPATEAQLSEPTSVAIGPDGDLYISDWGNNRIRKVVLEAR